MLEQHIYFGVALALWIMDVARRVWDHDVYSQVIMVTTTLTYIV